MNMVDEFTDMDAYNLIYEITVRKNEPDFATLQKFAQWALSKSERADWLQDALDGFKRTTAVAL